MRILLSLLAIVSLIVPHIGLAEAGNNTRVSVSSANVEANAASSSVAISADGKQVAFASTATNLVSSDGNSSSDVFVYDVADAATTRISVDSSETEANGASTNPHIAGVDGRYVVFESEATNLISSDTNALRDCFLRDRDNGTTERVNPDVNGSGANAVCSTPKVSADGRFVVFASGATDLVSNDTNGKIDIFLRDRTSATTTRVSVASDGTQSDEDCSQPVISSDGAYVLFSSSASTLASVSTGNVSQVYLYQVSDGSLSLVSVKDNQTAVAGSGASTAASISDDGRYVAFQSAATNLVTADTNGVVDCFVRDRTSNTTERVSVHTDGTVANGGCANPAISGGGRYVAFSSEASNLATGDSDTDADIFVRDVQSDTTAVISDGTGDVAANGVSTVPAIEEDGNRVVFLSAATNLVASDANGVVDAFLTENDICPDDSAKTNPGTCGCGTADTDTDGDSVADCRDDCPANPLLSEVGRCGCDNELDANDNGTPDCVDPTTSTIPSAVTVARYPRGGRRAYRVILQHFSGYTYRLHIASNFGGGDREGRNVEITRGNSVVLRLRPGRHRLSYVVNIESGVTSQTSLSRVVRVR